MHWLEWARTRLKVISKAGKLVPFIPNRAQRKLYAVMEKQRELGLPIRIIVLKSRRQGISTGFEAYCFTHAQNEPNRMAFVCAHDTDSSQDLFAMNQIFEKELPEAERRPKKRSSKREIVWEQPHWSRFQVQTAGNISLKRGALIHYLHLSELAFYRNPTEVIASAMNAVPPLPDTAVLIECTANGAAGEFYDRWNSAVDQYARTGGRLDDFVPLFFGWLEDPDNTKPVPKGYVWGGMSDDEERLITLGAKPEHLYWRRWFIHNHCNEDLEKFHEDYPATPAEAFKHSGRPAIGRIIVDHHESTIEEPRRCRLYWDENAPRGVRVEWGEFEENCWLVWRDPRENHGYTMGGDIATGQLSAVTDQRSEPDRNAAIVLDRRELMFVAGRISDEPPDVFGEEMVKAAWWYNTAWASPEVNGPGMAALAAFRRCEYPNIYQRENPTDDLTFGIVQKLGWYTSPVGSRNQMIDDFIAACRPAWRTTNDQRELDFEGKLVVPWAELVREEETFEVNKRGIRKHRDGCHDDILFACFIALQLHLRCPSDSGGASEMVRRPMSMAELNAPGARDRGFLIPVVSSLETT